MIDTRIKMLYINLIAIPSTLWIFLKVSPDLLRGGMNTPPGRVPAAKMPSMSRQTQPDERTFFLEHTALAELTGLLKPNPFWEEMSAHPDYDAWWQERDLRRACYNVQPAVLVVGGTFDAEDCFGAWTLYRALNRQSPSTPCHLVVGPWAHGAWRNGGRTLGAFDFGSDASWEYYMEHFEVPFFDHYLRDGNTDEAAPLPARRGLFLGGQPLAYFPAAFCRARPGN